MSLLVVTSGGKLLTIGGVTEEELVCVVLFFLNRSPTKIQNLAKVLFHIIAYMVNRSNILSVSCMTCIVADPGFFLYGAPIS